MVLDIIVLTAPNEQICNLYREILEEAKASVVWLQFCEIRCYEDPSGIRIGSGGGTLRALAGLGCEFGIDYVEKRVTAIIHSGGDSQRSPLHSVCGKAWSSVNAYVGNNYATAFTLLLNQIGILSSYLLPGSVLISCSDVLLDLNLNEKKPEEIEFPSNCVCAVAIPELLSTARNHGVFKITTNNESNIFISYVTNYFQKPMDTQLSECVLPDSNKALIDSGLIIFHGSALRVSINYYMITFHS